MLLVAITTFYQLSVISSYSVFTHPTTRRFLKGNLFPQVRCPTLAWDLNLVFTCLTRPPFESMATCTLLHLPVKTAFLIAFMSAQRVALMVNPPPFTVFFKDKVTL